MRAPKRSGGQWRIQIVGRRDRFAPIFSAPAVRRNGRKHEPVEQALHEHSGKLDPRATLGFRGQMKYVLDVPGGQLLTAAAQLKKDPPHQAPGQREHGRQGKSGVASQSRRITAFGRERRKRGQQVRNTQRDPACRFARNQRRKSFILQRPPEGFLFAREASQARQDAQRSQVRNPAGEAEEAGGECVRACGRCLDWWHPRARIAARSER